MQRSAILTAGFLLSLCGTIYGGDTKELTAAPRFFGYGTFGGTGWTDMECDGSPPFSTITCEFTQVGIRPRDDASFQDERAKLKASLEAEPEAKLLEERRTLVELQPKLKHVLSAEPPRNFSPEQADFVRRLALSNDKALSCADKPCIIDEELKYLDSNRRTCYLSTNRFRSEFKRSGPNKWVSVQGPQGICNVVLVQTLENDPDYPQLWTFTQTRATSDNKGPCEGIEVNKPGIYSWDAPNQFDLNCQVFEWSVF